MLAQILQYSGPLSAKAGQFMRVVAQWTVSGEARGEGPNKPWDVRWHKGIDGIGANSEPLLVVTRHSGLARRCGSNVAIFSAASGQLLKVITVKKEQARHMRQANMILLD
jgi:hypothetical protein